MPHSTTRITLANCMYCSGQNQLANCKYFTRTAKIPQTTSSEAAIAYIAANLHFAAQNGLIDANQIKSMLTLISQAQQLTLHNNNQTYVFERKRKHSNHKLTNCLFWETRVTLNFWRGPEVLVFWQTRVNITQ